MIYDGAPSRMLPSLVAVTRRHLAAGYRCMYINSPAMVAGFRSQLYAAGTDVEHEIARGALVLGSDDSHLVAGRFEIERMIDMLEAAVTAALADGFVGLFATGDMTWEPGPANAFGKLLGSDGRLDHLFHRQPALTGICQYHRDLLPPEAVRDGFVSHFSLFINDTISRLNPHYVLARSPDDRRLAATAGLDDVLTKLLSIDA